MKRIARLVNLPLSLGLALGAVAVTAVPALAEDIDVASFEYVDVIEKHDGSIIKGVIVEQEPGKAYKIATADGSLFVINSPDVARLSKERNKNYRGSYPAVHRPPPPLSGGAAMDNGYAAGGGTGVRTQAPVGSGLPAPFAESGTRLDFEMAILFPRDDFADDDYVNPSFAPTFRVGHEEMFGNFGLTGGGMGRFTYWLLNEDVAEGDALWTLETMGFVRTALHLGRAAPYLQLALGIDTNYYYVDAARESRTEVGLGVNISAGTQVAVSDSLAVDFGADFHPGTDTLGFTDDVSVSYFGLRIGVRNL